MKQNIQYNKRRFSRTFKLEYNQESVWLFGCNIATLEGRKKFLHYTDDTAMAKSVSRSLLENKKFDAKDLAKKFTEEYFKDKVERGYGIHVPAVFLELSETNYEDPFGPASKQFNGSGSFGNGGAMRIMPAALFGLNFSDVDFFLLVENIMRISHSQTLGINGAILEAAAIRFALRSTIEEKPFESETFLADLHETMTNLEVDNSEMSEENEYVEKLKAVETFIIRDCEPTLDEVAETLGNDEPALESVPTAIYAFLRALDDPKENWEKEFNSFERTIIYAIAFGW